MSGRLYGTRRWRRRAAEQLQREPLCAFHLQRGLTIAAVVADHTAPHNGDPSAFWGGPLQSLCKACHDQDKQREELVGFTQRLADDGWPVDPRHLANAPEQAPKPLRRRRTPQGVVSVSGRTQGATGRSPACATPQNE